MTGEPDILICGGGLAGLFLALRLAPRRCRLIALAPLGEAAATAWAQGGLAAALAQEDHPSRHARDTVAAGAGLVDPIVARLIAESGPDRVRDLLALGVPFDRTADGELALSLEAAHSCARVARVSGDLAGRAIIEALIYAAEAASHIEILAPMKALSLLQDDTGRICGVLAQAPGAEPVSLQAAETILCAGGSGGLYSITTNPRTARGDALAMAYDAGALILDPEFVQFHPTAIDIGRDPAPLATEALRGDGARLIRASGRPLMEGIDERGDLAPRDILARAIHSARSEGEKVFLDCRTTVGSHFPERFPTVFQSCMSAGLDPRIEPIPVAPAMHYHMGGVSSDLWGRSSLEGLSVCGECASTGAHGANRLASNSLLEAVAFAERIAQRLKNSTLKRPGPGRAFARTELPSVELEALRRRMSADAGVVRNEAGLSNTLDWIADTQRTSGHATALTAARLIAEAALHRRESRGGHFRSDHPASTTPFRTAVVRGPGGAPIINRLPQTETGDSA
jgi:L-aspartate oxidase